MGRLMRVPHLAISPVTGRWAMAAGLILMMTLAATAWRVGLDRRMGTLSPSVAALRQQLRAAPAANGAEAPGVDFAQRLPETASVDPVVRELQRSSAAMGAAFVSVSSTPRAATRQALGRIELTITLRGAYPKLKTVIAETLDRFPNLIVQRLTLRRMATPADLEAHVDLVLVTRPQPAPGAGD